MFKNADLSVAVGNASPKVKKAAGWKLNNEYDKGTEELFEELKKLI